MTAETDALRQAQDRLLRHLPSVDRLVQHAEVVRVADGLHDLAVRAARETLAEVRERVRAGTAAPELDALALAVADRLTRWAQPPLRSLINATGVIVHTNLGRAPLGERALRAVEAVGRGYSNLEYELEAGQRGSRHEHVVELLRQLTGAESGLVVNNNAAGVLLALTSLAAGREVIISRGELVEIGGGFRIPDVLRQSGARLVEVGTTNRTYAADYEAAIGPETALLLRVHASNYRLVGFTHRPEPGELAGLAHRCGLLFVEDLGSGAFLDTSTHGLAPEPVVLEALAAGADLVCFSGDKLLGGPQAGVLVGRAELIDRLKRHPLTRALRPDKLTIAALAATLLEYLRGSPTESVPVWRMIATTPDELQARGEQLISRLGPLGARCRIADGLSAVGGGSLPGETLPSRVILVDPGPFGAARLADALRAQDPPVVARVEDDRVVLDLRTVQPEEDAALARALTAALQGLDANP